MGRIRYIVGVDEAGRGPLAGPVAVGVAVVPQGFNWRLLKGVNDSKKLSEKRREEIFLRARALKNEGKLNYCVSMVSARVVDRVGIARAVAKATARAMRSLSLNPTHTQVKLDGLLKAPEIFIHQETIVGGDGKEKIIGLASIVAKVTRDRYMVRISAEPKFAPYTFHLHKGYGTKAHCTSIKKYGLSEIHRQSYCKNVLKENGVV